MDNIDLFLYVTGIFFAFYMFGYATYITLGGTISIWSLRKNRLKERMENELDHDFFFPISILVPAYNESKTILTTVNHLLEMHYKLFEVVIIDDGSTDTTAQLIIENYNLKKDHKPIRIQVPSKEILEVYSGEFNSIPIVLVRKKNGGNKADAVNAGINISRYPYFVSMDADEVLQADALKYSTRLFLEDDNVIAVGGQIRIANGIEFEKAMPVDTRLKKNPIVSIQTLEYIRSFITSRIFHDTFNANLNISGGFGLFKKDTVIAVGGYDPNSVGEDMDLVLRLHVHHRTHQIPYSIKYTPDAVCWTQAPFTLRDLGKQRARWHRGLIQCMLNYRVLFLNPKFKAISLFSYTYYFLYELMAPFAELLGIIVICVALMAGKLNISFAILIALLYLCFCVLQTILIYMSKSIQRGEKIYMGDVAWTIFMAFAEVLLFRPVLFFIRIYATLSYTRKLHSWSSIERENLEAS
ncbi:glycosyltransferase family 2 protein [Litchfieldia salsa]|uniref:Glycosyltransferase, catalytic subunit of cellulose synthase and poly-beta-1,6-N-acetylglucosamine synthase n=1 Tax=Litchfieldia salsa TaxID=930152 RepID=A0A1H0UDH3_9BACI|nr:glycosyltransferase [Litchfieldia salsa]SDP64038.1 Glycosyltransferase, catalytic subunit of cellulose synthase and poly-beta-1,6-N-acetylglucosamine synthase [Litchfieldia salsa]